MIQNQDKKNPCYYKLLKLHLSAWILTDTYTNKLCSILHLKVNILSQFNISGLREFQSFIVHRKMNTSVFTDGGMK